jgi:hypothetical protein
MVIRTSKEKLLKSLIPTKHVVSCRVIANKRKFGIVERACLLILSVKSCHRQFVAAAPHHLMGIAKKPFHSISVHDSWTNTLTLHHTVELNDGNMAQQQSLDAKPSFICKKVVCSCVLLFHPIVMQFLPL